MVCAQLEGDKMSVSATKEEKRGNTTTVKQFNRHVDLPHGIDHDLLESYLFPDGTLTIEAPLDTSLTSVHSSGTYSTISDLHHNNNNNHRYNNGVSLFHKFICSNKHSHVLGEYSPMIIIIMICTNTEVQKDY